MEGPGESVLLMGLWEESLVLSSLGGEWQLRDFGLTNQRSSRGSRQQGALEEEEERRSRRLSGSNSGGDSKGVQGAGDDLDASLERDSWENAAWKPRGADGREGVGGTLSHGNRGQWSGKVGGGEAWPGGREVGPGDVKFNFYSCHCICAYVHTRTNKLV